MKFYAAVALICVIGLAGHAQADMISIWTFGPNSAGYITTPTYDATGSATLSAVGENYDIDGGNGVAFTDASGTARGAGQALHWTDVSSTTQDAQIRILLNLVDWQDISVRWDYESDNSGTKKGPVRFDFDYRLDAGDWISVTNNEPLTRDDAWHEISLSLPAAVNGQASVEFRWNDIKEDTSKDGDYWQDNIQVTGTSAPEPGTMVLLGLGALVLRRRRVRV